MESIPQKLRDAVENFVKIKGGGYVGFCAGAYTSTRISGTSHFLGFNLMTGFTIPYMEPGNLLRIMPIEWKGKLRHIYFEGGPYLAPLGPGAEVIAHYPDGKIAAARMKTGNGRVFVTGLHPEAPQWWRDFHHFKDPDGTDFDLVDDMIRWVMKKE